MQTHDKSFQIALKTSRQTVSSIRAIQADMSLNLSFHLKTHWKNLLQVCV